MSVEKIHLQKLLRLIYAKPNLRRRLLLSDISRQRRKDEGLESGGGDFHSPFWADAKAHIVGTSDLIEQSKERAKNNKTRRRLYPLLAKNFLGIWNEKIRWKNEKFEFHPRTAKGQLPVARAAGAIKVENVLSVAVWNGTNRFVYPYCFEEPALSPEGVRLGFWVLQRALPSVAPEELRLVDVLRRAYFRSADFPMQGNEENLLLQNYLAVMTEWKKLRGEG